MSTDRLVLDKEGLGHTGGPLPGGKFPGGSVPGGRPKLVLILWGDGELTEPLGRVYDTCVSYVLMRVL